MLTSPPLPPPLSCWALRAERAIWEEVPEPFLCPLLLYALASSKRLFFFMASMIKLYPKSYFLICLVLNFLSCSPKFNMSREWANQLPVSALCLWQEWCHFPFLLGHLPLSSLCPGISIQASFTCSWAPSSTICTVSILPGPDGCIPALPFQWALQIQANILLFKSHLMDVPLAKRHRWCLTLLSLRVRQHLTQLCT